MSSWIRNLVMQVIPRARQDICVAETPELDSRTFLSFSIFLKVAPFIRSTTLQNIEKLENDVLIPRIVFFWREIGARSPYEVQNKSSRSNEEDARSVASKRSGSSGSPKARDSTPAEEEEEDLWTVWGELIRNWDQEVKKKPQYIKVPSIPVQFPPG